MTNILRELFDVVVKMVYLTGNQNIPRDGWMEGRDVLTGIPVRKLNNQQINHTPLRVEDTYVSKICCSKDSENVRSTPYQLCQKL